MTTPEYRTWHAIKQRCLNPKHPLYPKYGGVGITICEEWSQSFRTFLNYVGNRPTPEHSIDRINALLGYGPGNCRWATKSEQASNLRTNRLFDGYTLMEWSRRSSIPYPTLYKRVVGCGWSIKEAVTKPIATKYASNNNKNDGRTYEHRPTKEYRTWLRIKAKCSNPNHSHYSQYGAKGIKVSEIWINDFDRFLMDVGKAPSPKHSLDRIDGRKGYEPGNCRWADSYTQSNNCKHVNLLTAHGRTLSIPEWSRVIGINTSTIRERIRKGWPTNKALSV